MKNCSIKKFLKGRLLDSYEGPLLYLLLVTVPQTTVPHLFDEATVD